MEGKTDFSVTSNFQLHFPKGLSPEGRGDALPQVSAPLQQPMAEEAHGKYRSRNRNPTLTARGAWTMPWLMPWLMPRPAQGRAMGPGLCRRHAGVPGGQA